MKIMVDKKKLKLYVALTLVIFAGLMGATETQSGAIFEPGLPTVLSIPKLEINAPITSVGLNAKGEIGVTEEAMRVAWYRGSPRPGLRGSAVISGHFDTKTVKEAIFHDLSKLKKGDKIEVLDNQGQKWRFKVKELKTYTYDDPALEVFATNGSKSLLNLITCVGDWLPDKKVYSDRLVVFTELDD